MSSRLEISEFNGSFDALCEAALQFVPIIRRDARKMELARRLDEELVEQMETAGLFSVVVPKRWGGAGLGPTELNKIVEIIGSGDCSTGWVTSFYNLHNWFLCRFPFDVQQDLFAKKPSVRSAAVFGPPGKADRVIGGYRVSGKWGYATGILHASHAMVPAIIEGSNTTHWFIVPRKELEASDDWDMASMSATGSVTVAAKDVFVAEGWGQEISKLMTATEHQGTVHAEEVHRYPFSAMVMAAPSLALGALDMAVEISRERLLSSRRLGFPCIERPAARIRWINAYEASRVLRLLRDGTTEEVIQRVRSGKPQTIEDEARTQLHLVTFIQGVKDAMRLLVDGNGTSGYRSDDPVRRSSSDIAMLATHALGMDYDTVIDRHARWILGRGIEPGDPQVRIS